MIVTFEDYKNIGYTDKNCVDIFERVEKEKQRLENEKIISEIMLNIQNCDIKLSELIMWSLDDEEEKLFELVKSKGKEDWINQWMSTKSKSLKKDVPAIHFSDLSHLRSILSWIKSDITNKIKDNSKNYQAKEFIKKIIAYLESYISQERNESFHSRLQLY